MNLNLDCVYLICDEIKSKLFFVHTCRLYLKHIRYKKEWFLLLWEGPCSEFLGELVKRYVKNYDRYGIFYVNVYYGKGRREKCWVKKYKLTYAKIYIDKYLAIEPITQYLK